MNSARKVIVYIATSLDGYIAGPDGDMSFLGMVEEEGQDYGYGAFFETVDTVILGRKTYDWVQANVPGNHYKDRDTYVITRSVRPSVGKVQFYNGDLKALVGKLKGEMGKHIFIDGGAEVVHALLKENLVDEFYVSIIPVLLGGGVQLWKDGRPELLLRLVEVTSFPKGLVQLHYVPKDGIGH